jgi:transcriptional regulator of NAD metabolism
MITRQPINERILKEDFYVDDENMRKNIMKKLENEARKYIKGLDKRNIKQTIKYEDKTYRNHCEACLIF